MSFQLLYVKSSLCNIKIYYMGDLICTWRQICDIKYLFLSLNKYLTKEITNERDMKPFQLQVTKNSFTPWTVISVHINTLTNESVIQSHKLNIFL